MSGSLNPAWFALCRRGLKYELSAENPGWFKPGGTPHNKKGDKMEGDANGGNKENAMPVLRGGCGLPLHAANAGDAVRKGGVEQKGDELLQGRAVRADGCVSGLRGWAVGNSQHAPQVAVAESIGGGEEGKGSGAPNDYLKEILAVGLVRGDCFDVMARMPRHCIDLVVTDPPWGIAPMFEGIDVEKACEHRTNVGRLRSGQNKLMQEDWDMINAEDLIVRFLRALRLLVKNKAHVYMFGPWRWMLWLPKAAVNWKVLRPMFWYKSNMVAPFPNQLSPCYEVIYHLQAELPGMVEGEDKWHIDHYVRDVFDVRMSNGEHDEGDYHPSMKPVAVLKELIDIASRPGDIVLDPFAGSGSTGVAAKATSRRPLLIEKEEKYCKTIERRLANTRSEAQKTLIKAEATKP